jgi:unsaturated rhamnogalacturonyl hydrolase
VGADFERHKSYYPQQQWLDGLYMAHPTYALYAATFEPNTTEKVFTDIGHQFELAWKHCRDAKTGLLRHGYDYSKQRPWADPVTGASPEVWDRVCLPPSLYAYLAKGECMLIVI